MIINFLDFIDGNEQPERSSSQCSSSSVFSSSSKKVNTQFVSDVKCTNFDQSVDRSCPAITSVNLLNSDYCASSGSEPVLKVIVFFLSFVLIVY